MGTWCRALVVAVVLVNVGAACGGDDDGGADDAAPAFPKGTVIHVTAWYDNTRANKNNPDPDQWVGYGDRTVDEMAHAWMNVVYLSDAEYQQWLAEHKAKKAQQTQNQQ